MPMIICPECKCRISGRADFCPLCCGLRKNNDITSGDKARMLDSYAAGYAHNGHCVDERAQKNQEYFDDIRKDIDPAIKLDTEQRRAIIMDDD